MKYTCPCCGFKSLDEPGNGTFEICCLCGWENDSVQSCDPDYEGGPNGISLREAQHEFLADLQNDGEFERDCNWQLLDPPSNKPRSKNGKVDYFVSSDGEVKNA